MSYVTIVGRIGRDAEVKQTHGDPVCNFSVAENIGYGDNQKTQWWDCALWGKRAEKLAQYLTKGTAVTVIGNPELQEFTKRDGGNGAKLTCRVIDVVLQSKKQDGEQREPGPSGEKPASTAQHGKAADFDDDIPF